MLIPEPDKDRVLTSRSTSDHLLNLQMALGLGMRMPAPLKHTLLRTLPALDVLEIGLPTRKDRHGYVHVQWSQKPSAETYQSLRNVGFVRQGRGYQLTCFIGQPVYSLEDFDGGGGKVLRSKS